MSNVVTKAKLVKHASKYDHLHGDKQIIVSPSGGDFTSIQDALNSINDATANNRYDIIVYPGIYHETFTTKDYVNVIGQSPSLCIVDYDSGDGANSDNYSTVYATSTSLIENLTIKSKNAKYPIHTDFGGAYDLFIKNCYLWNQGDDGDAEPGGPGIGIGLWQSQHLTMEDCIFNVNGRSTSPGIYLHNIVDSGYYRSFVCKRGKVINAAYGIRLHALDGTDNQSNDVMLENNEFNVTNAEIFLDATSDAIIATWNRMLIGNTLRKIYQPNLTQIVEQIGFTRRIKCAQTGGIKKGDVLIINGAYPGYAKNTSVANSAGVVGVALQDLVNGEWGVMQVSGFVDAVRVNGTTPIVAGDFLVTYIDAQKGVSAKGTTNIYACAQGAYALADSNGLIPAILLPTTYV